MVVAGMVVTQAVVVVGMDVVYVVVVEVGLGWVVVVDVVADMFVA